MDGVADPEMGKVLQNSRGPVHIGFGDGEDHLAELLHIGQGLGRHFVASQEVIAVKDLLEDLHAGGRALETIVRTSKPFRGFFPERRFFLFAPRLLS